ncbi:Flp pilus assembly pilin Flp [Rhodopirellula rubra]|uniref:Flp pilus assembly pilin Flp n=1 Tax=Aporhodopirellula rubra TaxID=980271 RepID=A0A7W5E3G0_9BACT|nr:Flp family type IVb pilin [Aporhodopirellula rubra]MBB3209403.1 Flp pilus assembly pilin Flp [Aporhodopirellula rubra]
MTVVTNTPHLPPSEAIGTEWQTINCNEQSKSIKQGVLNWIADEDGTTAVEYAVMVAMIAVTCMVGVNLMTQAAEESFTNSAEAIGNA